MNSKLEMNNDYIKKNRENIKDFINLKTVYILL